MKNINVSLMQPWQLQEAGIKIYWWQNCKYKNRGKKPTVDGKTMESLHYFKINTPTILFSACTERSFTFANWKLYPNSIYNIAKCKIKTWNYSRCNNINYRDEVNNLLYLITSTIYEWNKRNCAVLVIRWLKKSAHTVTGEILQNAPAIHYW